MCNIEQGTHTRQLFTMLLYINHNYQLIILSHDFESLPSQDACRRAGSLRMLNLFIQGIAGHPHLLGALEILVPIFTMSTSERKIKISGVSYLFVGWLGGWVFSRKQPLQQNCVVRVAGIKQDYSGYLSKLDKCHPGYSKLHSKVSEQLHVLL